MNFALVDIKVLLYLFKDTKYRYNVDKEDIIKVLSKCSDIYSNKLHSEFVSTLSNAQITLFTKWRIWRLIDYFIAVEQFDEAINIFNKYKNTIEGDKVLNTFKEKEHP